MRKMCLIVISLFWLMPAFGDTLLEPLLNTVTLQLSAEQWVASKTALVTIGINASVSDNDLDKTQSHLLDKLNQLAGKAEWHIVSFNRSLDQSGLEKVQAQAQARLTGNLLAGLRDKAKSLSKPGETFNLDNVQFIPSDDEIRDANMALRNTIYQQAKAEVDQLNKSYADQKYYVHQINFLGMLSPGPIQNTLFMKAAMPVASNGLAVGGKLRIIATVVLAAAPNPDVVKMVHN
ncbi:MAG: hypothetical protein ACD_60C00046G0002 [uncultured bacterium]|nr:MAG: hypothetical protein ACD_60C00046G0002 [uncultured bacterium]